MPRPSRPRPTDTPPRERASISSASEPTSVVESFLNTTFSLHRISPLFLGSEPLTSARLSLLASRLRDTLVGDVVRGVEVGLEGDDRTMGSAGALEAVGIEWTPVASILTTPDNNKALHISLQYENAVCTALAVPLPVESAADDRFLPLPLLLLRMPGPLKAVILDFLSTTFDCRVSPLRLQTKDLVNAWEGWIREAGLPTKGPLAKDAVLTLGFDLGQSAGSLTAISSTAENDESGDEGLGIKAVDIIIPHEDLRRFLRSGQALGANSDGADRPFTDAVALYVKHHLALDMFHPGIRITRVACGGFVLSTGRLKIFRPSDETSDESPQYLAVRRLLGELVRRAKGVEVTG